MKKFIPIFTVLSFIPLYALACSHSDRMELQNEPSTSNVVTQQQQPEGQPIQKQEKHDVEVKDFAQLTELAQKTPNNSEFVYPIKMTKMGDLATIYPSVELKVINSNNVEANKRDVMLSGFQMEGADNVIYQAVGQRSIIAVVTEAGQQQLKQGQSITDDYDNIWHQVTLSGSIDATVLPTRAPIWNYANRLDSAYCGTCHSKKDAKDLTVNSWGPVVKSMAQRTNISKDNLNILTKFFEYNAKDAVTASDTKAK